MNLTITPSPLAGEILIPPSKSILHRALICAALAKGESVLHGMYLSEDVRASIACIRALGASVRLEDDTAYVRGIVSPAAEALLPCGESGSTLRFFIPVAGALGVKASFTGRGKLVSRPLSAYDEAFEGKGVDWKNTGSLPCSIAGHLQAGDYQIDGSQSSQFISGLLFALPLLDGNSTLTVTGRFESQSYVAITLGVLRQFGVCVEERKKGVYAVFGGQTYRARTFTTESDYSQSAFFLVAGALGASLRMGRFSPDSTQGDKAILSILASAGCPVQRQSDTLVVSRQGPRPFTLCAEDVPDLVPVLCVLACGAKGESKIFGVRRLRIKESDRIASTLAMLAALGGSAGYDEASDCLTIAGRGALRGGTVNCENDHRIAMSGAVAALLCKDKVTLLGAECVKKSYPTFWEEYVRLGGKVHVELMD